MDNKKLLNFLLNDLSELDELFAEKSNSSFDALEMEFLRNRLKGAKKLVQILIEKENPDEDRILTKTEKPEQEKEITKVEVKEEKVPPKEEIIIVEKTEEKEIQVEEPKVVVEPVQMEEPEVVAEPVQEKILEPVQKEVIEEILESEKMEVEKLQSEELEMEEEEIVENPNKRLGDSFLKEKSVNDLIAGDSGKLEHKLSNRPVTSIQTSIGINDRFQFIRELFEGSSDDFTKTVTELDNMSNLKDAVSYLQQNFKWKKNDTSLKFVNLVKRRFPNE